MLGVSPAAVAEPDLDRTVSVHGHIVSPGLVAPVGIGQSSSVRGWDLLVPETHTAGFTQIHGLEFIEAVQEL
jgi:hypothetical protein